MNVYVQGLSALAHYRSSEAITDVELCSPDIRGLAQATSSARAIAGARIWRLGIGEPSVENPIEVLVHDNSQRRKAKAVSVRVWREPIAPTGFRKVADGIYVSSPEFVFLQMATRLELPELVALGMELCGTYRRQVRLPHFDTGEDDFITVYQQEPLSSPRRLKGLLDSMKSAPGHMKASKALSYVLPNSASPMETALYLLLCLPRRMGGYALPKPELNPGITFNKAGQRHTLRRSAKPDLYWRDAHLDLEYNSDEFHSANDRAVDSMRRKALERMNVEVIELTTEELFSTSLFHATALRIALRLHKQIRPEHEGNFIEKRADLRKRLLLEEGAQRVQAAGGSRSLALHDNQIDPFPADEKVLDNWTDEYLDDGAYSDVPDFDDTWYPEIEDFDDGGHVYGRGAQEVDPVEAEGDGRWFSAG